MENLGDFLKAGIYFNVSFHTTSCPLPFTKQTCCTTILKKMQSTSLEENIEYQTLHMSNYRNMGAPYT